MNTCQLTHIELYIMTNQEPSSSPSEGGSPYSTILGKINHNLICN